MNSTLWNDQQTDSDSTEVTATTTTPTEQSPIAAAIEASSWSRADIELLLSVAQVLLLIVWVVHTYNDD